MTSISNTNIGLQPGLQSPTFTTDAELKGDTTFSNLFQQTSRTLLKNDQDAVVEKQAVEIEQEGGEDTSKPTTEKTADLNESFTQSTEYANGDIELIEADTEGTFATTGEDSSIDFETGIAKQPSNENKKPEERARFISTNISTTEVSTKNTVDGVVTNSQTKDVSESSVQEFSDKVITTDFERNTSSTDSTEKPAADKPVAEKPVADKPASDPIKFGKPKPAVTEAPSQPIENKPTQAQPEVTRGKPFPGGQPPRVIDALPQEPESITIPEPVSAKPAEQNNGVFSFSSGSSSTSSSTSSDKIVLGRNFQTAESSRQETNSFDGYNPSSASSSSNSGVFTSSSNASSEAERHVNSLFQSLMSQLGW